MWVPNLAHAIDICQILCTDSLPNQQQINNLVLQALTCGPRIWIPESSGWEKAKTDALKIEKKKWKITAQERPWGFTNEAKLYSTEFQRRKNKWIQIIISRRLYTICFSYFLSFYGMYVYLYVYLYGRSNCNDTTICKRTWFNHSCYYYWRHDFLFGCLKTRLV